MVDHILHGNGQSVLIAQHDHTEGVPDEDSVDAALVHDLCCGVVVSSKHRDLVT